MVEITKEKGALPKYLQLSEWLKNMIDKGRYAVGERLPSEIDLSNMFNVNRNTVRQAIQQLVNIGLVIKKNGIGTFVSSRTDNKLQYSLQNMAEKLMLGSDNRAIRIKRIRYGNGIPLVIERSYLSYREYGDIMHMEIPDSLYQVLIEHFGAFLERSVQTLRAIDLPDDDAKLLGLDSCFPAMLQESIIFDKDDIAVELLHSIYRGDKFVFRVNSGRFSPTNIV